MVLVVVCVYVCVEVGLAACAGAVCWGNEAPGGAWGGMHMDIATTTTEWGLPQQQQWFCYPVVLFEHMCLAGPWYCVGNPSALVPSWPPHSHMLRSCLGGAGSS